MWSQNKVDPINKQLLNKLKYALKQKQKSS